MFSSQEVALGLIYTEYPVPDPDRELGYSGLEIPLTR